LHRKALRVKSADFAKSGSLFQSFLKALQQHEAPEIYEKERIDTRSKGFDSLRPLQIPMQKPLTPTSARGFLFSGFTA
ncbi:hypothetical protein QK417_25490, partial [Pseudomonas aeruginosa]|nr:hypothetical protein [Pseudomonas aeruginosa]